eukprot:TRINITY_DN3133_c0_g1_i48.p2 TRINITY_DN3133_c0_g1~~TRINITY_DN3133_c0_g1_i48.p2  ORF type:complete len:195 (-),score=36.49 TRINITY_DN3133_c0_g1_i48:826-1410(-)
MVDARGTEFSGGPGFSREVAFFFCLRFLVEEFGKDQWCLEGPGFRLLAHAKLHFQDAFFLNFHMVISVLPSVVHLCPVTLRTRRSTPLDLFRKINSQKYLENVKREIELLSSLDHPNIIKLVTTFSNDTNIYMVMDYADKGDLHTAITNLGCVFFPFFFLPKFGMMVAKNDIVIIFSFRADLVPPSFLLLSSPF